jgi:hypothetical protein
MRSIRGQRVLPYFLRARAATGGQLSIAQITNSHVAIQNFEILVAQGSLIVVQNSLEFFAVCVCRLSFLLLFVLLVLQRLNFWNKFCFNF